MIISIQYMRAIAAILVVINHVEGKARAYSTDIISGFDVGRAGVDLFFIISGYIMCYVTFNKRVEVFSFIKARFVRIVPLYWVLTTIALIASFIRPDLVNSTTALKVSILDSYFLWPGSSYYLIENGWTLSYEFYFYFIFSLGLFFSSTLKYWLPSIILFSSVLLGVLYQFIGDYSQFLTDSMLLEFVYGIIVFSLHQKIKFNTYISVLLLFFAISLLVYENLNGVFTDIRAVNFGIPFLIFFIAMLSLEETLQRFRNNTFSRIIGCIGDSSYSLYLIHPFALVASSVVLSKLGMAHYGLLFVFVLTTASISLGYLCYVFLEKSLTKYVKNLVTDSGKVNA